MRIKASEIKNKELFIGLNLINSDNAVVYFAHLASLPIVYKFNNDCNLLSEDYYLKIKFVLLIAN